MAEGSRRAARERALGLLYEAEARGVPPNQVVELQPGRVEGYAASLANGVSSNALAIDSLIGRFSRGWDVERMPATDRALLRLAVWELMESDDVPTAVVISEAVELAKRYSTEESGRFVNGVLAAIAHEVRPSLHQRSR